MVLQKRQSKRPSPKLKATYYPPISPVRDDMLCRATVYRPGFWGIGGPWGRGTCGVTGGSILIDIFWIRLAMGLNSSILLIFGGLLNRLVLVLEVIVV